MSLSEDVALLSCASTQYWYSIRADRDKQTRKEDSIYKCQVRSATWNFGATSECLNGVPRRLDELISTVAQMDSAALNPKSGANRDYALFGVNF